MYGQRRGLAHAQQVSDDQARDTNFTLMQKKKKQQLEQQIESKQELLKQYTNPRGIGMRGQTVPQKDVDLLKSQIEQLQYQLEVLLNPNAQTASSASGMSTPASSVPPTPQSSARNGQFGLQQQQQFAQQQSQNQPPTPGPLPRHPAMMMGAPGSAASSRYSTSSTRSKRDEVWEKKYQNWLERTSSKRSIAPSVPALSNVGPVNVFSGGAASQPVGLGSQNPGLNSNRSGVSAAPGYGQQQQQYQPQYSDRHPSTPQSQWGGNSNRGQPQQQQQGGAPWQQQQQSQQQPQFSQRGQPQPQQQQQWGGQQNDRFAPQQRGQPQPQQQQQQQGGWPQQQQQQPQYGRRATPTDGQRPTGQHPNQVMQQPPMQQQQQQSGPLHGRRSSAGSTRPW